MPTDATLLKPASLTEQAPDVFDVEVSTTKGNVTVQVTRAWSPLGADRFYNLVKHGYFTDAAFFRNVPGFIVQFGLSADPAVNKVWRDANIKDDPSGKQSNAPGTITSGMDVVKNLYSGYGERPDQGAITMQGKAYLDANFTKIDSIKSATIV